MFKTIIKIQISFIFICFVLGLHGQNSNSPVKDLTHVNAGFYLTRSDKSTLFTKIDSTVQSGNVDGQPTIAVNTSTRYQEMDGFGYCLTGGSAEHISKISADKRHHLLTELFANDENNIGVSFLRLSLGASDLDETVFSYDDLPQGETDINLDKFSLNHDRAYLIPVIKEILEINPDIKFLASPWSAPTWMKTNGESKGGSLKTEYFDVYARYFVKYIQQMANEGINIYAITIQNEPLHPGNNPSMYMTPEDQASFIKKSLGPAFQKANIKSKIIIYDHNADRTDYPISILNDPEANKYVDGSAFHLYGGSINDLMKVHNAYPDKNLYFTEQWVGAGSDFGGDLRWHTENLIIGAARNYCKAICEWNLAANSALEPHTPGGCTRCLGALTIDGDTVTRNVAYYIIAHASKFVRPGSVRIESNSPSGLSNVAFLTPENKVILIVLNTTDNKQTFNIRIDENTVNTELDGLSVGTYILN